MLSPIPRITACLLLLLGNAASAASFDCSKANTTQEKLICSDDSLGALDDQLARAYKQRLNLSRDRDSEKRSQIRWLAEVRDKCSSKDCMRSAYEGRLSALKAPGTAKGDCPLQEASLVGVWVIRSGSGFFEEMAFGMDGTERGFDSWLHHRPEFSGGSWALTDCTIYIKHSSDTQLGIAFRVTGFRNGQLHVTEDGQRGESIYKRVGK